MYETRSARAVRTRGERYRARQGRWLMAAPARLVESLPTLAEQINAEHQKWEAAARDALGHALKVGELLIEAKAQVTHGEWGAWVDENCAFSQRTAQLYMQVAREIEKSATVADLTLSDAAKLLAAPKADEESGGYGGLGLDESDEYTPPADAACLHERLVPRWGDVDSPLPDRLPPTDDEIRREVFRALDEGNEWQPIGVASIRYQRFVGEVLLRLWPEGQRLPQRFPGDDEWLRVYVRPADIPLHEFVESWRPQVEERVAYDRANGNRKRKRNPALKKSDESLRDLANELGIPGAEVEAALNRECTDSDLIDGLMDCVASIAARVDVARHAEVIKALDRMR